MKCPKCVEEGKKSLIRLGMTTRTAMNAKRFYDDDGNLHIHDDNITTIYAECSNGHHLMIQEKNICKLCNYASQEIDWALDAGRMVLYKITIEANDR